MCDDYDGGDSGIDTSFDDTGLDTGTTASFDVDSVMDAGGDDYNQFETPAEPIDTDITTDFDDGVIADPVEGEIEQIEIPDEVGNEFDDSISDVNSIMDLGEDDFEQFEVVEESAEQQDGIDIAESTPIREYDDFEQIVMLDNPDFYESGSFYLQGLNEYGYQGTCGPTSQANALNEVLGTNEFTENKILDTAVENGLCNISDFPEDCGGTTTEQFMELYDNVNEQTGGKFETELFEYDNALGLNEAAAKLDEGSVLNVAVDSYALWGEQRSFADPAGGFVPDDFYSDHWITVTGAQRDELGNVAGFNVIDSGGGVNYVTAQQYQDMCFGTEEHKVIDPTCIAVSKRIW